MSLTAKKIINLIKVYANYRKWIKTTNKIQNLDIILKFDDLVNCNNRVLKLVKFLKKMGCKFIFLSEIERLDLCQN